MVFLAVKKFCSGNDLCFDLVLAKEIVDLLRVSAGKFPYVISIIWTNH